jgi:peptidoglycan/LPS O-acetylase OafA/YrhL
MQFTFRSKASASSAYRADIDGLRAIAVLAVVLFHAKVPGFSGGFVGVDVFFVISGYLITKIIEGELQRGNFSFLGFYERRIRRIFPALFTVILGCLAAGIILLAPRQLLSLGRSILAATGFISNIYFKSTSHTAGYFADGSTNQFLLHTWSLSLEEQFYVLFPLLLLCLHKVARRFKGVIVLLLALTSLAVSVYAVKWQPVAAFYLLPSRAWELLAGALLVFKPLPPVKSSLLRSVLGLIGLAAIAYSIANYTETTPFPGLAALLPCLGAVLLLYAGEGGASWVTSAMSFGPLVFLGAISYSLYLWHWPFIVLTKYYYAAFYVFPAQEVPGMIAALLLAILTFEFVETPFRTQSSHRSKRHPAVWIGVGASALLALIGVGLIVSHGFPQRFSTQKTEQLTLNDERKTQFVDIDTCANFQAPLNRYEDAVFCSVAHAPKNVLFWGDSHMSQLYPLLQDMATHGQLQGRGAVFAVSGGCSIGETFNFWQRPGFHCDTFTRYALQRAAKDDIDTVFLVFSPWWALRGGIVCTVQNGHCVSWPASDEIWSLFIREMESHIRDLHKMGKRVVLTVPFPTYDKSIPDLEIRNIGLQHLASGPMYARQMIPLNMRNDITALASRTGADLYNPRETLCKGEICTYQEDQISIYSDESHIATSQLERFRPGLLQVLNEKNK